MHNPPREPVGYRKYLKMLRPFDYIVVFLLIVLSFLPIGIFVYQQHQTLQQAQADNVTLTAVVSHNGKNVYTLQLTGHKGKTTYRYKDDDGHYNVIVAEGNQIQITEANCQDQVCVRRGKISRAGDTIVCLPHKLIIEIKASNGQQDGGMVTE